MGKYGKEKRKRKEKKKEEKIEGKGGVKEKSEEKRAEGWRSWIWYGRRRSEGEERERE